MNAPIPDISVDFDIKPHAEDEPPYRVIIHNDDLTPMDYVLFILQSSFSLTGPRAVQVMFSAHYNGSAYVVSFPKFVAQRRINWAHMSARLVGYPLRFTMERE